MRSIHKEIIMGCGKGKLFMKLLDMLYTPAEIQAELKITDSTLKAWIKAGAPVRQDGDQLWIHGTSLAAWWREEKRLARQESEDSQRRRTPPGKHP